MGLAYSALYWLLLLGFLDHREVDVRVCTENIRSFWPER